MKYSAFSHFTFSSLHVMSYLGKSISYGTVYILYDVCIHKVHVQCTIVNMHVQYVHCTMYNEQCTMYMYNQLQQHCTNFVYLFFGACFSYRPGRRSGRAGPAAGNSSSSLVRRPAPRRGRPDRCGGTATTPGWTPPVYRFSAPERMTVMDRVCLHA